MRREGILQSALCGLSWYASASERAGATAAIRGALADLPLAALDYGERAAAEEAVRRVNKEVKARLAAKEAKARGAREEQQRAFDEQQRKSTRGSLVQRGVDRVWFFLLRLRDAGELSEEEYEDIDQESLNRAVGRRLQSKIAGDETDNDLGVGFVFNGP
jgi:hypothetical protein